MVGHVCCTFAEKFHSILIGVNELDHKYFGGTFTSTYISTLNSV